MPLPETYLSQAPQSAENQFGVCLSAAKFVKMLKRCNPEICVPTPEQYTAHGWRFSEAHLDGQTSIWWGQPSTPGEINFNSTKPSRKAMKITSIVLGPAIPEYTQFNVSTGLIEQKGWREAIRRVVMCGAATKEKVEKVFKVSLDCTGTQNICRACEKKGMRTPASGKDMLCVDHHMAMLGFDERQKYLDYLDRQLATRGDSQVGYTTKEDMCLSLPSPGTRPLPKESASTTRLRRIV